MALEKEIDLESFKGKISRVTVSGLSAGAYMAHQLQVAYSKEISGAAIVAGGFYRCANGSMVHGIYGCMAGDLIEKDFNEALEKINEYERDGLIDPLEYLKDDHVFLFSGTNDVIVHEKGMLLLKDFFDLYPVTNVISDFSFPAGHGMVTESQGSACDATGLDNRPWLLNCNRDLSREILETMVDRKLKAKTLAKRSNLFTFSQLPFISFASGLGSYGHIYIPSNCLKGATCDLHMALHGCDQTPQTVGDAFIWDSGYNQWAESNDIIILYPSASRSYMVPLNPMGCFDWWGYTGPNYANKRGVQPDALMKMIRTLKQIF
ncbi:hypothetical protein HBN50_07580 [Halobacteriovorax sp. GB3]|uniref:extracellular catalytic domain type 2 short-chain-length polyhydroxyalkanoate depolymerase n=1 Tax=Halobacteriovorax sp. GB3 TaxID=2719615 RepID=UPI002361D563|nr:hypothetical protein [Halobacteriovorax sp. GB3]MDD0852951.1 hypothetical protein [Halobacteriovorax sp. GB3]